MCSFILDISSVRACLFIQTRQGTLFSIEYTYQVEHVLVIEEPDEPLPVGQPIVELTDNEEEEELHAEEFLRSRRGIRAGPTVEEDKVENLTYLETQDFAQIYPELAHEPSPSSLPSPTPSIHYTIEDYFRDHPEDHDSDHNL